MERLLACESLKIAMGVCRFCERESELRISHIIPAFVWDWLRETSISGMRSSEAPNRRIQDGLKIPLLCENCEQRFSAWERLFATKIFRPMHKESITPMGVPYDGTWVLKFCVSVSWRVLQVYLDKGFQQLTVEQQRQCKEANTVWKEFLNEKRSNPGPFEQHLIPLDVIEESTGGSLSPFINRYLTRVIDISLPPTTQHALTYAKMGRLLLIGFAIPPSQPRRWQGTKVRVQRGIVGDSEMKLPEALAEYINERANYVGSLTGELSTSQREKIAVACKEKSEEIITSDVFRAMIYDVHHSADGAFTLSGPTRSES